MEYLENLTKSLSTQFGSKLPGILGALVVLIIGFFIAKMVKKIVEKLMAKTAIDEKIGQKMQTSVRIDKFIAKLVYYLIVLFTLVIVLDLLGAGDVLAPLQDMLSKFLGYIPNIILAGILTFAGYIIASIVSEATGFLSERLEGFGKKMGMDSGSMDLSKIVKQIVFIIIFIPILIMALDALNMSAISDPAKEILSTMMNAIPNIIFAVVIIGVCYIIGKYAVAIVTDLLRNLGLDDLSSKMGLNKMIGDTSLSGLIGSLAMFFIMFMGVISAADKLELTQVQDILNNVMNIAGKVFFGMIILMAGIFISNLVSDMLSKSQGNSYLTPVAKFAIMGIFLAFALHTMGIAESIVNLAFGLTLGSVAIAFALSFGLGGREAAGKQMDKFFNKFDK